MNKKLLTFALRGNPKLFSQLDYVNKNINLGSFKDGETYL